MKLKIAVTVMVAVVAVIFIAEDFDTKKTPAVAANASVEKYEYNITTIYTKCGHSIVTKGVKNINNGDETVYVNNYCPYHYKLYEKDGLVAVGMMDNPTAPPIKILEIQVSTLPYSDIQALKEGIQVYGEESLEMLIEDFNS